MATTQAAQNPLASLIQTLTSPNSSQRSTSTSSGQFNSQAGNALNALLGQTSGAFSKDAAIADANGVLAQLAQQLTQQNMPSVSGTGRAAGLYNSTTQNQLTNDLQARIQGEVQKAAQANIANYAQIEQNAGNTIANLNNSSRVQTASSGTSTKQAVGNALLGTLLTQGLGALGRRTASDALSDSALDAGGDTASALGGSFLASSGYGLGDTSSLSSLGAMGGGDFGNAAAGLTNDFFGTIGDTLGGVVDTITSGVGDFFGGIGDFTGWWANGGRVPGPTAKSGKDNVVIGVGGGEAVLPVDTVQYLDKQLGERWLDDLISATHTKVKPDPTAAAMQTAKKFVQSPGAAEL